MRRSGPNILRLRALARGRVRGPSYFYPNNTNTKVIGPLRNWVENPAPAPIVLSQEDDRQRPARPDRNGAEKERSMARRLLIVIIPWARYRCQFGQFQHRLRVGQREPAGRRVGLASF